MNNEIELLAPVGSYESLISAIKAGANSIYFGVENLNMRSRSSINFTLKDLSEISRICKLSNIRTYITLNTVMYDEDMPLIMNIIDAAKESGIDAIIATDLSVISYARSKNVTVHISTQLSVSNIEAVKFYSSFADVIVLARELSLEQITNIIVEIEKQQIKGPSGNLIKIEVFIHGALCMAISGKCFLSQHMHNASANRGECYQVCRREFHVFDDQNNALLIDNQYIMSPKDLCTLHFLDKIVSSGIKLLKIEGRGRSPEYVKTVVSTYREALNLIANNQFTNEAVFEMEKQLKKVYNRGFWDGHYLGKMMQDWNADIYGSKATTKKVYVAKCIKYFKKICVGEFLMESGQLSVGDTILIIGPTSGTIELIISGLRENNLSVNSVNKGAVFSMPVNELIRSSDKIYRVVDTSY
jgi:U32 family peptidase